MLRAIWHTPQVLEASEGLSQGTGWSGAEVVFDRLQHFSMSQELSLMVTPSLSFMLPDWLPFFVPCQGGRSAPARLTGKETRKELDIVGRQSIRELGPPYRVQPLNNSIV
eukprot:1159863-Pelagomonas_calceolata.AAC.10